MGLKGSLGSLASGNYYLLLGHVGDISRGIKARYFGFAGWCHRHLSPFVEFNEFPYRVGVGYQTNFNENSSNVESFALAAFNVSYQVAFD